jgi:RNA polymerase sigma factor (sigma-70 family)
LEIEESENKGASACIYGLRVSSIIEGRTIMRLENPFPPLREIRTEFHVRHLSGFEDAELLKQFTSRDAGAEAAFVVLLERYGAMVLGVCRRMLADPNDVEDAFQATFLVLVSRGGSVQLKGSLGPWLHGVARRVASRMRGQATRRRSRESSRDPETLSGPACQPDEAPLRSIVAEEIGRLPEVYRAPIALCGLMELSYEEASRQLGWKLGTLQSRLARGRTLLRARLLRRGIAVPGGLLGPLVKTAMGLAAGRAAATGAISARLVTLGRGTLRAIFLYRLKVAALVQGLLKAMFLSRLKAAAAVVLALGIVPPGGAAPARRGPEKPCSLAWATTTRATGVLRNDTTDLAILGEISDRGPRESVRQRPR